MFKKLKDHAMKKICFTFPVFLLLFISYTSLGVSQTESLEETDERRGIDVSVSAIRAQVSPQFEIALPNGNISQHFVVYFNDLEISFNLFYRVVDSNVGGDITFDLLLGRFRPYITFFQSVDFEKLVEPQVSGGDVLLVPTSKYLDRQRGFTPGLSYEFFRNLSLEPSLTVNDIFKGNLTESTVVDEGVDIIPRLSLIYDGIRVSGNGRGFFFNGLYGQTVYSIRYRDRFNNPISSKLENRLLASVDINERLFLEEELTFNTPITVWGDDQINFYSLGGYGSMRGYDPDSISAIRFFRSSLDVEQRIFGDTEITIRTSRKKGRFLRIHQFRLLYLYDLLVAQDKLNIQSSADSFMSLGGGFSFTLSGWGKNHFKTQIYAVQPISRNFAPIFYLRTSLFNLEIGTQK
jgi:hypothetical protein